MGKKKVKYHILHDILIRDLVEFIDDVQAKAIRDGADDNYKMIDLCNYFITHLINSDSYTDTFNTELPKDDDELPSEAYELNDKFRQDFIDFDANDLSDEEYEKMLSELDRFLSGWTKTYHKSNITTPRGKTNLKKYGENLKSDKNLTPKEQFELYYDEHKKQKEMKGSKSLKQMLDNLGIRLNNGGSDTI